MAIFRLLQGAVFSPEDIARMVAAYEKALPLIGLKDRDDLITEMVALKIIEVAHTGVQLPDDICAQTLKELGVKAH